MPTKRVSRSYTEDQKQQILNEIEAIGNVSVIGKKHRISPNTIHIWIRKSRQQGRQPLSQQITEQQEIKQLRKQQSEKDLENQILKGLLKKTRFSVTMVFLRIATILRKTKFLV